MIRTAPFGLSKPSGGSYPIGRPFGPARSNHSFLASRSDEPGLEVRHVKMAPPDMPPANQIVDTLIAWYEGLKGILPGQDAV